MEWDNRGPFCYYTFPPLVSDLYIEPHRCCFLRQKRLTVRGFLNVWMILFTVILFIFLHIGSEAGNPCQMALCLTAADYSEDSGT